MLNREIILRFTYICTVHNLQGLCRTIKAQIQLRTNENRKVIVKKLSVKKLSFIVNIHRNNKNGGDTLFD